jgi:hypothetical protein
MAVGGSGSFDIYRNVNGGAFSYLASIESGDINFLDTDVLSGNTYCYQFVQDGIVSEQFCKTYLSVNDIGTPEMRSIARMDDMWVEVQFTSAIPEEGYFQIWNNYHMEGWIAGGGTAVYTGTSVISKVVVSESAYPACFKVEQLLNGISTGFSNELCLAIDQDTTEYVEPAPANSPKDLRVNRLSNPLDIKHAPIYFDGVYVQERDGIAATHAQVQVSYDPSNWSNPLWDSGMSALSSPAQPGERILRLAYGGAIPMPDVSIYWRIRLTDEDGLRSAWSEENAMFSIAPYESGLKGIWSVNGTVGTLEKQQDNRPDGTHAIAEHGAVDSAFGFDGSVNGSYFLKGNSYLNFEAPYTPASNPISITMELSGLVLPSGQAQLIHAYENRRGSYISIYAYKVNCCVAKLGIVIKDSRGNITSYADGADLISQSFQKIDVNIYNNPNAMIEIFINGTRYQAWPVYSEAPYYFESELDWLVGGAMQEDGSGVYNLLYGKVDEIQIYDRIRTEAEIHESYLYSRQ